MEKRSNFGSEVVKYNHDHHYLNKLSVEELLSIGLSSWPVKYYTCSFCKRQLSSAQALGGHMDVHRGDRARLRSQLPSWVFQCTTPNPNPNLNSSQPPRPSPAPSSSISPFAKSLTCKKLLVDDQGHRRDPFYDEIEELMKMKSMRASVVGFEECKGFSQPKCELDRQVLIKGKKRKRKKGDH